MTRCVRPRAGAAWPAALPMIPYMRANLARKRRGLAAADAVIAVSSVIARRSSRARSRAGHDPNGSHPESARRRRSARPRGGLGVTIGGPLCPLPRKAGAEQGNVSIDPGRSQRARLQWPLVIAGDGPDRASLEVEAGRLAARCASSAGWTRIRPCAGWGIARCSSFPRADRNRSAACCSRPARWEFPLRQWTRAEQPTSSRTSAPVCCRRHRMNCHRTYGGWPSDRELRERLGAAARARTAERFDSRVVVTRVEELYFDLKRNRAR